MAEADKRFFSNSLPATLLLTFPPIFNQVFQSDIRCINLDQANRGQSVEVEEDKEERRNIRFLVSRKRENNRRW